MSTEKLSGLERRSITALASVYGLRMFGLFLILPVLVIYAKQLNATPVMMGIALGVYGITQAIFQIPFGLMSDKYGRKPIIIAGLLIFIVGSLIAALSNSIEGVIIGRALQGTGAIASVVLALTSDLTRDSQRTKAMAFIGMTIGLSFLLALITAPLLEAWIGVPGLFLFTAALAGASIVIIIQAVPTPIQTFNLEVRAVPQRMLQLLGHSQLIRLNLGIFVLHFVLTAMFVVVPMILVTQTDLVTSDHWQIYLPALLLSILAMLPLMYLSSKKAWTVRIFLVAILVLLVAQLMFVLRPTGLLSITTCLFVFFWGFNLLEAMLPSLVSRVAPAASRGSAMGVYNTFQFSGVFFGGLIGGLVYGHHGANGVFLLCGVLLITWFTLVKSGPPLRLFDSLVVRTSSDVNALLQESLVDIDGVYEAVVIAKEQTAYLKVDKQLLDHAALNKVLNR